MFTHEEGSCESHLHTAFDLTLTPAGVPSYRLVTRQPNRDVMIPYNPSASATLIGWYFVTDSGYASPSRVATRFVKVMGPEPDIVTDSLLWDPIVLEEAAAEKEQLRALMGQWYPTLNRQERYYEDYFELTAPPPFSPLTGPAIRAAIDHGCHFLSLSGHGAPGGCCGISIYEDQDFRNQRKFFIASADSCSTAQPDCVECLGGVSVLDSVGGAVGYVGNTRYGWIGAGDHFEQSFWDLLRRFGRLGPAAGLRWATHGVRCMWTFYAQTLYGDPEMPVWTSSPMLQQVTHPKWVNRGRPFTIAVHAHGRPLQDHQVTLLGGWTDSSQRPALLLIQSTDAAGQVTFTLPADTAVNEVQVTVTATNHRPHVTTMAVRAS